MQKKGVGGGLVDAIDHMAILTITTINIQILWLLKSNDGVIKTLVIIHNSE